MQTLEQVRKQIGTAEDLYSIVRTMKAIAMVNIRHYQRAVDSINQYNQTVQMGLQIVMQFAPEPIGTPAAEPGKTGLIVFGTDQGLVGQFNQIITGFAKREVDALALTKDSYRLLAVGIRTVGQLKKNGLRVDSILSLPGSLTALTALVQEMLFKIVDWTMNRQISRVYLIYNEPTGAADYRPTRHQLIPVNTDWLEEIRQRPWEEKSLAFFRADQTELFTKLISEHFFLSIFRALAESLASENASRLKAMQAAEKNIEERIDELQHLYHLQRQTSITEELMDVITGFEALKKR